MVRQNIKCPTCKRKIHYQKKVESNPATGESFAICKFCKSRTLIGRLKLKAVA